MASAVAALVIAGRNPGGLVLDVKSPSVGVLASTEETVPNPIPVLVPQDGMAPFARLPSARLAATLVSALAPTLVTVLIHHGQALNAKSLNATSHANMEASA